MNVSLAGADEIVLLLGRSPFGMYRLEVFERGGWEQVLLAYVGAQAGRENS